MNANLPRYLAAAVCLLAGAVVGSYSITAADFWVTALVGLSGFGLLAFGGLLGANATPVEVEAPKLALD